MPRPPASRYRGFEVVLDDLFKFTLSLRRAPQFLRFSVVRAAGGQVSSLDALDQFGDVPEVGELIVVAEKGETNPCHIRFTGDRKSQSGWYLWVKYTSVPDQPPDAVVRDTDAWREWCRAKWGERRAAQVGLHPVREKPA